MLAGAPRNATAWSRQEAPLGRAWLEDRGGEAPVGLGHEAGLLHPEELSSLRVAPCLGALGEECLTVGTTARRLVQLAQRPAAGEGAAPAAFVPRRLLRADHGEVPAAGALALLGRRYLALLHRGQGVLSVLDLRRDGKEAGRWMLPRSGGTAGGRWASICSGGGALYALASGEEPSLWRFPVPPGLSAFG